MRGLQHLLITLLLGLHAFVSFSNGAAPSTGNDFLGRAKKEADWLTARRRDLHRVPELLYQEVKTSAYIRKTLDDLGVKYQYPLAKTGVVARVGSGARPLVALRADFDALPIQEEVDVLFASTHEGRMHACGHDAHTAMLLGAAKVLKEEEASLKGTVLLIFQPAEEGGAGAEVMLQEGIFQGGKPDAIFGIHVNPTLPTGTVGSRPGTLLAGAMQFAATIEGKGGHGAMPHLTIDPIVAASAVVTSLQDIVSRQTNPLEAAVVSVTLFQAGTALNVIPPEAKLAGTFRSLTRQGLYTLRERIRHAVTSQAAVHGCNTTIDFSVNPPYPPTVNDKGVYEFTTRTAAKLLGKEKVVEIDSLMGAEDFSFFLEDVPGCMVFLGINNATAGSTAGLHTPNFQMDETMLPVGVALHLAFAIDYMAAPQPATSHRDL